MISEENGKKLLKFARKVIENHVRNPSGDLEVPVVFVQELKEKRGLFCTLTKQGQLRGCIGFPEPTLPLINACKEAAISSTHDPRFPDLTKEELLEIKIELSILTKPEKITVMQIKEGDGVILRKGMNSGLYLPQVWEQMDDKNEFLNSLSVKAGMSPTAWRSKDVECFKFSVQIFKE